MTNQQSIQIWKISSAAVLVGCIALVVYVVLPYISNTLEKYQIYSSQKESLELVGDWSEQLEGLEEKQKVLDESLTSMYIGLPKEQEFSTVIASLFSKARTSNVNIVKIEPSESQPHQGQLKKKFSLELQSEYHQLARFINRVEQGDYLINLQQMSISSNPQSGTVLESRVEFELTMQGE
ncbi:type 4a pilus biogenesis protein PilO [Ulvibacterium sp.]|uniref:type 4a pilus biogenesis protein PilO n=1 Tax=Ulvibacterium sp. TaxID=2665914 RepID=UPI0026243688|nr:type 4a pilus biogenesis protein PilO [Ulvibacterium sp.]